MGRNVTPLFAVCMAAIGPCFALAGESATDADVRARLAEVEAKLAAYERQNGDAWLTEQRSSEIRALVQDVLADADTRASLLQGGSTAGWDKGFFLASADGNFKLKINGQMQIRYVYNHQEEDAAEDTNRSGFENRRTKLTFEGNVIDPTWVYHITGAFERDGGSFVLEDAFVKKAFDNGWEAQVGQFKLPFMREELVSSKRQLAVDRSLVNEEYNQDRSQGIQVTYKGDQFAFYGAFSDGFASSNVPVLTEDVEYAFTGRVEILFAGDWKQFSDFTSWKGEDFGFLLGAAAHYERAEYGTASGPEETLFTYTVDASLEFGGANLFGAIVGRSLDEADVDQYGVVVQGGLFLNDEWELFGRLEWSDFDTTGVEDLTVATIGVNKYIDKHNLKWTTDVGYGIDAVNSPFSSSGVGWRADAGDEDGQIVFRSQLQLLF